MRALASGSALRFNKKSKRYKWKDYWIKRGGRMNVMRLNTHEFIRRFLRHVLPDRFHRIRHYGVLAGAGRKEKVTRLRALLGRIRPTHPDQPSEVTPQALTLREPCPDCGGPTRIIETFRRGQIPQTQAPPGRC